MRKAIWIGLSAVMLLAAPAWAQDGKKQKDQVVPQSPLPAYFGPKKRAMVSALEVKVQAVSTTVPTPSGTTSVVSLDLQQPTEFGTGLTEMLTTALVESKRFIVLERQNIDEILKEQQLTGADPGTMSKAGRLLGAQVLIKGSINELSFKRSGLGGNLVTEIIDGSMIKSVATVGLDLKIVDVETGQVLESVRAEGRVGSQMTSLNLKQEDFKIGVASFDNGPLGRAVRSAIQDAVKKICERTQLLPWQARIAEMVEEDDGLKLYLNAGGDSGLKVGDVLEITRPGPEIKDPETGIVIGRAKGKRLGSCRIESIEPKLSVAVIAEGSGFQKEDVVRFPDRKAPPQS